MKINLKVRFKNPVFWMSFVPAIVTFVYSMLGCFGIVPTISEETIVNIFTTIITALTTWGVLIDPTTAGTGDSDRALTYTEPQ